MLFWPTTFREKTALSSKEQKQQQPKFVFEFPFPYYSLSWLVWNFCGRAFSTKSENSPAQIHRSGTEKYGNWKQSFGFDRNFCKGTTLTPILILKSARIMIFNADDWWGEYVNVTFFFLSSRVKEYCKKLSFTAKHYYQVTLIKEFHLYRCKVHSSEDCGCMTKIFLWRPWYYYKLFKRLIDQMSRYGIVLFSTSQKHL